MGWLLFPLAMRFSVFLLSCLLILASQAQNSSASLLDKKATNKTNNLYSFLRSLESGQTLFGHQDDLLYGLNWKYDLGSDVEIISGNRPSVIGWDIGKLGNEVNIDSFQFTQIIKGIKHVYRNGGVNTISWHMDNPLTGGSSWDKESDIKELLPGGKAHKDYLSKLDEFSKFIKKCKVGWTKIPIIFRPFHEHNGDWFWWGKSLNEEDDYIALWRFTVNYLKDERNIHNLIYAFSPDRSRMAITWDGYHYGYPGDEYVDIIGLDNYWDMGFRMNRETQEAQYENYQASIRLITQIAQKRNKVAALTETGNETVRVPNWFTERLLSPIKSPETTLAWVLVWRNANMGHFYVPYKGHHNEKDFIAFEKDESTLFLTDIRNPYKKSK